MLKSIICALIAATLSSSVCAEVLTFLSGQNDRVYKATITSSEGGKSVSFYRDGRLLGAYDNLIMNSPSLSSELVPVIGGGVALEIESIGSRNKYDIVAPIVVIDDKLYVECLYKNVYDSVDGLRYVGAICQRQELSRFDVSASINVVGLPFYTADHNWLASLHPEFCANAVGLEVGSYRIARCADEGASETRGQKIIVLDQHGKLLFSIVGYELIPLTGNSKFFLTTNLNEGVIVFKGDFLCYAGESNVRNVAGGVAKIDSRIEINYSIGTGGRCLGGSYDYKNNNRRIMLKGSVEGGAYYLLELGRGRGSSGVFILDKIKDGIRGVWMGVPPKALFVVGGG